ncbi:hypothetical protein HC928_26090, partial [bacterium]|nr:hypothetical protein [bacterium]
MLTPVEQMIFILLALFSVGATYEGFREMYLVINRGTGKLYLNRLPQRALSALGVYSPSVPRSNAPISSLFHLGG